MEIFGLDTKTIVIAVIIYGIIMTLLNLLVAVTKIRESINKTYLGAFDTLTSMGVMTIWHTLFRDTDYISPTFFWAVTVWCIVLLVIGMATFAFGIMSSDSR